MPATWKQTDDAGDTSRSLSNIGEDLVITGNVTSKGEIQIEVSFTAISSALH